MESDHSLASDPTRKLLDIMAEFPQFCAATALMLTGLPEDVLQELLCEFVASDLLSITETEDGEIVYVRV